MPGPSDFSFIGDRVRNLTGYLCSEDLDQNGIIVNDLTKIVQQLTQNAVSWLRNLG